MTDVLDGPAEGANAPAHPTTGKQAGPKPTTGDADDASPGDAGTDPGTETATDVLGTHATAEVAPSATRAAEPGGRSGRVELSEPMRYLVAALSAAAGVIHLAMVPSHVDEWPAEGTAFALAGWAQLVMALLVLTRPSRVLLRAVVASNLVFVGAWAVTRTAGSPFGPHAGHAESMSSIDLAAVGFEVALAALAGALLARPAVAG